MRNKSAPLLKPRTGQRYLEKWINGVYSYTANMWSLFQWASTEAKWRTCAAQTQVSSCIFFLLGVIVFLYSIFNESACWKMKWHLIFRNLSLKVFQRLYSPMPSRITANQNKDFNRATLPRRSPYARSTLKGHQMLWWLKQLHQDTKVVVAYVAASFQISQFKAVIKANTPVTWIHWLLVAFKMTVCLTNLFFLFVFKRVQNG